MQAFKKVDKVHNVKDNGVLEVSEYYLVANNVGLGEAVCARQGSRVGRHSGMGIVSSNYSHWVRPSLVPEKKETAPGNVKHEVANYVSLKHGHWAPQCGMQIDLYQSHKLYLWRHSNSTQWLLFLLEARSSCRGVCFAQGDRTTSSTVIWLGQEDGYSPTKAQSHFGDLIVPTMSPLHASSLYRRQYVKSFFI